MSLTATTTTKLFTGQVLVNYQFTEVGNTLAHFQSDIVITRLAYKTQIRYYQDKYVYENFQTEESG